MVAVGPPLLPNALVLVEKGGDISLSAFEALMLMIAFGSLILAISNSKDKKRYTASLSNLSFAVKQ
jgi:hypothetical protein